MLDNLDNGREDKGKRVISANEESRGGVEWDCLKGGQSCRAEDMCPRNGANFHGINIKLGKNYVKMISDESEVPCGEEDRTGKCPEEDYCVDSRQVSRMTGSSCRALKCAVSTLHRLDDFNMEKIGSGFFSEVFKVTHKVTGNVMVLKMNLLRSNRPNMLKEVQLMNQLKHRNILNFLGVCVHEGQLHALTEFINGGSLEQLIQSWNIELPYLMRQELALDIARGMEYLHGKGVFHRDLTSKNVLIKKSDNERMMAVVGDFGLAAKIPDPKSKYRLPTVGSAYWMSPECLKGQWYNEKSDIFSYGIVLCEMIARIEADPDVLPRTDNFGLDYLAFSELCGPCPPHFLKLAFSCSTFEPKSRPSFAEIVKTLERLIPEYEELLKKESDEEIKIVNASSLDNLIDVTDKSNIMARSEEVINKCAANTKGITQQRKLHHRRSLSEDVVNFLFPRHTAPSDKARHHILTTPKHPSCEILANPKYIGESMCQVDPHYKPRLSGEKGSRSNPFLALSQFRGVKKIVGSQHIRFSKDGQISVDNSDPYFSNNDLFSSCFELPSPFYGITPPSSPVTGNSFDEKSRRGCCGKCFQEGCDLRCENAETCLADESVCEGKGRSSRRLFPADGCNSPKKKENSQSSPKIINCCRHQRFSRSGGNHPEINYSDNCSLCTRNVNQKNVTNRLNLSFESQGRKENCSLQCGLSMSLPSSPTPPRKSASKEMVFAQKETEKQFEYPSVVEPIIRPKKLIKSRTDPLLKSSSKDAHRERNTSHKTDTEQKQHESSSFSSRNLSDKIIFQENLPEAKDAIKCEKNRSMTETELNPLVTTRMSSSSSSLLECNVDYSFLMASNVQLKRRGSCESGFFSCIGEDYITGNETLPSCDYVLQTSRQKLLDNSSATFSSSSAASSLFLLDDSLSTTTVSSLRSGKDRKLRDRKQDDRKNSPTLRSGDFNDLDDLPSKFTHHSILFSGKRSSSIYTDSSEDVSSLGDVEDRNQSRYQSQQISKIVEYFERKQMSGGSSRSEGFIKYRKNQNVEFQKNIERFDSSKTSSSDKIKWEGLEGKFKKSGMGLSQKREENMRLKHEVGGNKGKKSGYQHPSDNVYPHDLPKRFDGSSISDAIRKSKIELLRKSLEKGTLQVPGITPYLSGNSGVSGSSNEKNSSRPLSTRLMICEGAVKSKLPLFDKK